MTFEELLDRYHLMFTPMLDEGQRHELEAFWNQMVTDSAGSVGESEIDDILDTYGEFGILQPQPGWTHMRFPKPAAHLPGTGPAGDLSAHISGAEFLGGITGITAGGSTDQNPDGADRTPQAQQAARGSDILPPGSEQTFSRPEGLPDSPGQADEPVIMILSGEGYIFRTDMHAPDQVTLVGIFTDPDRHYSFEAVSGDARPSFPILKMDMRFYRLFEWLGRERIGVVLQCRKAGDTLEVFQIRASAGDTGNSRRLIDENFLESVTARLLVSSLQTKQPDIPQKLLLSDMRSIEEFYDCVKDTLPANIRQWAMRNIRLTKEQTVSPEEKRHAQRALSLMAGIEWKKPYFESIDPEKARRILDEELYGLENVKQRVIETIIQINRTHTLPSYGMLLAGPAGVGKSQIAYAVARILKLPWVALDMSTIVDPEALTGSPRVYTNAKPGRIMEAFAGAGSTSVVFVINELDKAGGHSQNGSPADTLLTLLDNLGFTDNYMECALPTSGVYPIATANDKSKISDPLISRFAVIDIPNYTPQEKKVIFRDYSLPKVMRRMHMSQSECTVSDEALDAIIEKYKDYSGVRELEQVAEHLAANALYRIETQHVSHITFTADMVRELLEE